MKKSEIVLACSAVFFAGILTGCTDLPTQPATTASATSWLKAPEAPVVALGKPYMLKFEKMSAKLTPQQEEILTALAPQLKDAKLIILRGYCSKRDIGNAKDSALARAINVEKFLVTQGIVDQKMSLRYNTDDAEHAVELEIGG
ncbi:OmpA family protein [Iodobacter fluviatilis]|uniref:OmpA family n=1 Tax=Iodobacter fluviatilis TaxID=537 RepID=A0A377Q3P9_9NEIS|nr:OmpA family protein [Iodobacter fluviatilis]TCU81524.1 OmpA family protein [Iodobacter fluviatilis]STQ89906.1 OmpA family [Iodobacter fluviatilis]